MAKTKKLDRVVARAAAKAPKAVERLAEAVAVATGSVAPKPTTGKTRYTNTRPRRSASWTLEEWRAHLAKKPPPPESRRWGTTEWLGWCHRTGYPVTDGSDTAPWSARVPAGVVRDDDGPAFGTYRSLPSTATTTLYVQRWRGRAAR